jgi:hypothetical protein
MSMFLCSLRGHAWQNGVVKGTDSIVEVRIPRSRTDQLARIFATVFVSAMIVASCSLAVTQFLNFRAAAIYSLVASGLWLSLVALSLGFAVRHDGNPGRFLMHRLGGLSRDHFVEIDSASSGLREVRLGYLLFGFRANLARVPLDRITKVKWNMGQASSMAREELDDWMVSMWYTPTPPERVKYPTGSSPEENLHMVGTAGSRSETESLGLSLVGAFRTAGLDLARREDGITYVVRSNLDEQE